MSHSKKPFSQVVDECRRTARLGWLLALAAALHVVEAQLPGLPLPGARLGLANLVSLLALYIWGWREAFLIAILRQVLGGLFTGGLLGPPFLFGTAGAVVSTGMMALLLLVAGQQVSPVFVSIVGAVGHNLAQLWVAYLMLRQPAVVAYLPYLLLFALPAGAAVGYLAQTLLPILVEEWGEQARASQIAGRRWARLALPLVTLVLLGVVWWFGSDLRPPGKVSSAGLVARVTVNGEERARLPLEQETVYRVPLATGHMILDVADGGVAAAVSDCPDQICVRTGRIRRAGQALICVPNRVVVTISAEDPQSQDGSAVDGVTG